MVKLQANRVERITLADPSRAHDILELAINRPIDGAGRHWRSAWQPAKRISRITVNLPRQEWAGQSVVLDDLPNHE